MKKKTSQGGSNKKRKFAEGEGRGNGDEEDESIFDANAGRGSNAPIPTDWKDIPNQRDRFLETSPSAYAMYRRAPCEGL
eukprot:601923-Amphidinium_carterae.1